MKFVSKVALGAALALGATVGINPAIAKKAAEPAAPQLSAAVRTALVPAQTAIQARDFATARAKVNEALAAATTADDKLVANQFLLQIAQGTNDMAAQGAAIDGMLASGKVPAADQPKFHLARGQIAYQANDWAKADSELSEAIRLGTPELAAYALLAESQAKQQKGAAAVATIQAAYEREKAAGRTLPNEYFARGLNIARSQRLGPQLEQLTTEWVRAYPTKDNWRDTLIIYRQANTLDDDANLDLMRLQRAAHALKGEADYAEYAQAVSSRFPGEAKAVISEGVSEGALQLRPNSNLQAILQASTGRITRDRADLPAAATAARAAAGGRSALATGDAFLGYREFPKAIEMYRAALQKGGVDASLVNTRIGIALALSGDAAGAKQAFASVTGPRAALARYWSIWLDQQGSAPAPAPAAAQPAS